jgi:hypothetical protein
MSMVCLWMCGMRCSLTSSWSGTLGTFMLEEGNASVAVDPPCVTRAVGLAGRTVGGGYWPSIWPAQNEGWGFLCSGMDLTIDVVVHFFLQDRASVSDSGDMFEGTGLHDAILNTAVGPFDLSFGLREGIDHLNTEYARQPRRRRASGSAHPSSTQATARAIAHKPATL